jgi:hypothetical protein
MKNLIFTHLPHYSSLPPLTGGGRGVGEVGANLVFALLMGRHKVCPLHNLRKSWQLHPHPSPPPSRGREDLGVAEDWCQLA